MKLPLQLLAAVAALGLAGCATSSLKQTWKSPTFQGAPVKKVAVIAVVDRGLLRQGFENRFVRDLRAQAQETISTFDLLGLPEIKADKAAAATRLRSAGADAVLVVRLVDQVNYDRQVRATSEHWVPTITGFGSNFGWYDCYDVAFMDMGTVWSSDRKKIYLDSGLHDLATGKLLWSGLTVTTLGDSTDGLVAADNLIAKIVAAMRKDGLVR
jgi:hypothetical protein